MKKLSLLFLMFVVLFGVLACSKSEKVEIDKKLVGKWENADRNANLAVLTFDEKEVQRVAGMGTYKNDYKLKDGKIIYINNTSEEILLAEKYEYINDNSIRITGGEGRGTWNKVN